MDDGLKIPKKQTTPRDTCCSVAMRNVKYPGVSEFFLLLFKKLFSLRQAPPRPMRHGKPRIEKEDASMVALRVSMEHGAGVRVAGEVRDRGLSLRR